MSGDDDQDPATRKEYEVGYGKPPKYSQFKPGKSGNPNGKKRKPKSVGDQMRAILSKKISITEGGKVKRLTFQEIILQTIANKAAKGDLKAASFVLNLLKTAEVDAAGTIDPEKLSQEDQLLFEEMIKELSSTEEEVSTVPSFNSPELMASPMTMNKSLSNEVFELIKRNPKLLMNLKLKNEFKWFIAKCFKSINPETEFCSNWHIDAIAWHLEQVSLGKIKRLIIAMPPRSAKSISTFIAFPAYLHGRDPTKEVIAVSYAQSLAAKLHNDFPPISTDFCEATIQHKGRKQSFVVTQHELRVGREAAVQVGKVSLMALIIFSKNA